jgi:hypothetical protein
LWFAFILGLSLGRTGQTADIAAAAPHQLLAALRGGKPIVLVIASPAPARPTDEAYGDWADALNDFAAHADPGVKIIKATARTYHLAIAALRISGQFGTLFVRDLNHALLYRGMILEPQVYRLSQDYVLQQAEPSSAKTYGLTSTTVGLRRGKIGVGGAQPPGGERPQGPLNVGCDQTVTARPTS